MQVLFHRVPHTLHAPPPLIGASDCPPVRLINIRPQLAGDILASIGRLLTWSGRSFDGSRPPGGSVVPAAVSCGFNEHHQSAGREEEAVGQVTLLHLFINVITVTQRRFSRPSNGRRPSGDTQPSRRTPLPVPLAACQHYAHINSPGCATAC